METKVIGRTHIVALQEVNGSLQRVELPIFRPTQLIAELKDMLHNGNYTVWDMQSLFLTHYPKPNYSLDYIYPFSYESSYVPGTFYPKILDYDELKESWKRAGESARQSSLSSWSNLDEATRKETEAIRNMKNAQKNKFFEKAMLWIDASCYREESKKLYKDSSIKMFSKESIGWNTFVHEVNNDIKVVLKTNFGFGRSSYFLLAVQYKGIDILPYSHLVKYYKAEIADIIRCTRVYKPTRDSWGVAFDFLTKFVNQSIADPKNFIESYIMEEVREMMRGLESISTDPVDFIHRCSNNQAEPFVVSIRPILNGEARRMQIYPTEAPILFKVEKIVGALRFLTSLTEIAKEVNSVQPYIDRVVEINLSLYPEVVVAIKNISKKIEQLKVEKANLEKHVADLSKELEPLIAEISQRRAVATNENPFEMKKFEATYPEYSEINNKKAQLQSQITKINGTLNDFNSFLEVLNNSISTIDKFKRIAEAA